MSRRLIAVVLAVLMIASTFLALGATAAGRSAAPTAPAPSAGVAPSVTSLSEETYQGLGGYTTTFYPGQTYFGSLFYQVSDSTTTDHNVNITLTDPNATRDGVPTPAYHYEATLNSTTHSYNSWQANVGYVFPATLPYGGEWTLNFSESATNYVDVTLTVEVYSINAGSSLGYAAVLPGTSYTIYWNLTSNSNGATLYTHATGVYITGNYWGNTSYQPLFTHPKNIALTGASSGWGSFNGVIPANATPGFDVYLELWAITNVSGGTAENQSINLDIYVGSLYIQTGLIAAPPACDLSDRQPFAVGTTLASCVKVSADWYGELYPVSGATATVAYWNGTTHVSPAGAPTTVTTNQFGEALFTFVADSPPFATTVHPEVYNAVNISVAIPGADTHGYHWTAYSNESFLLLTPLSGFGVVNVTLDKTQYFPGQSAKVTWTIHSSDPNATGAIDPVSWTLIYGADADWGTTPITGTAQSGTFTVPVTSAMVGYGYFEVVVTAANATTYFNGTTYAYVFGPELLLSQGSGYYTGGSSVSVTPTLEGAPAGTTLTYLAVGVWEEGGEHNLSTGAATNNSALSVSVPSTNPPQYIEIYVWATADGQVIADNDAEFDLEYGYSIEFGVSTASSYSDGSYQPGQSVTLTYAIVPQSGSPEPALVSFYIYAIGFPVVKYFDNVGPSGSVSFTIPSNAPRGTLILELEVDTDLAGPCFPTGECDGVTAVPINPSPSALSLELGAGSGVTVGWLIVLVLVLLVGAVGLVFLLRGRAARKGGSGGGSGSSSSPSEWKSPSADSGATPPASGSPPPTPPPGSM